MAYDLIVYARTAELPAGEVLAARLAQAKPAVRFARPLDLGKDRGFFPAKLDDKDAGFEISVGAITDLQTKRYEERLAKAAKVAPADRELLRIMKASDCMITLSCQGEAEKRAARLVAQALAELSHGWFCDPQTGEVSPPPGAAAP